MADRERYVEDNSEDVDLFFHNGKIWWKEKKRFSNGELVVRDGRISEVSYGSRLPSSAKRGAETVDLKGGYLCPSFIDAHMHLFQWSISMNCIDLSGCRSVKEVLNRLSDVIDGKLENPIFNSMNVLVGIDFDESFFKGPSKFQKGVLDSVFPEVSVVIRRICGHKALLNRGGMDLLNIDADDAPDGILTDDLAMDIPWRLPLSNYQLSDFYRRGVEAMFRSGVTGGVDIIPSSKIAKLRYIMDKSMKRLDTTLSIIRDDDTPFTGPSLPEGWQDTPAPNFTDNNGPPIIFEKFYLDGSIGSRTASFSIDYTDSPSEPPLHSEEEFKEMVERSHDQGLIPMVHCIGDRAISRAVKVLESYPHHYRLEHAESITKDILERITVGKGAVCLQPNFQYTWGSRGGLYHSTLGESGLGLNKFNTISGSGNLWCFGTDMMPPDPLYGIRGAIGHQFVDERLTLPLAVSGFTDRAANLSRIGKDSRPGFVEESSANLIMFDRALERIIMTIKEGKLVSKWTEPDQ